MRIYSTYTYTNTIYTTYTIPITIPIITTTIIYTYIST